MIVGKECSLMVIPNAQARAMETWECSVERQDRDCVRFLLLCRHRECASTLSGGVLPIESHGAMIDGRTAGRNLAAGIYLRCHHNQSGHKYNGMYHSKAS